MKKNIILFTITALLLVSPISSARANTEQINGLLTQISQLIEIVESLQNQILALQNQNQVPSLEGYEFTTDLRKGDTGVEVLLLQKALNKAGFVISESGAGSPGNETELFGSLTELAVRNLQANFASVALHPGGYYLPTGVVDVHTRNVLNSLSFVGVNTSAPQTFPINNNNSPESILSAYRQNDLFSEIGAPRDANNPIIFSISPETGRNNTTVTIVGDNFDRENNSVITESGIIENIPSTDGETITFNLYSTNVDLVTNPFALFGAGFQTKTVSEDAFEVDQDLFDRLPEFYNVPITIRNENGSSNQLVFKMTYE